MNYCFGVDIGGTTVKMGLFQFDGSLIEKWEIKTRTENEGAAILPDVAEAIRKNLLNMSWKRRTFSASELAFLRRYLRTEW